MSQQNKYRDADKNLYSLPVGLKIKSVDEVEFSDTSFPTLDLEVGEMIISKEATFENAYLVTMSVTTPGTYMIVAVPHGMPVNMSNDAALSSVILANGISNSYSVTTVTDTKYVISFTFPFKYLGESYLFVYKTMRVMVIRFS